MEIFVTSDFHFGHENKHGGIIKLCNRPFSLIEEHDAKLVENYNSLVGKNDIVYILGDFAWKNHVNYAKQLKGNKILIKGEHDRKMRRDAINQFSEVYDILFRIINDKQIIFCHWPLSSWQGFYHQSWHFHGHSHAKRLEEPYSLSCDVGVDAWDYFPVPFEVLSEKMKNKIEGFKNRKFLDSSELEERTKKLREENKKYFTP
jgi:calcineurin-like phosphoesterase family protein